MPKIAKSLSDLAVRRLQHDGKARCNMTFPVGEPSGLLLQITPNGGKSWLLRTMVNGRRREIGLGGYSDISLSKARERARAAKDAIRNGEDPIEKRKAQRAEMIAQQKRNLTFSDAVDRYLTSKIEGVRSEKHSAQWRATLTSYAKPVLGSMLVSDIAMQDVQRVLEPIWRDKNETASRVRGRIESVLAWATVAGYRTGDNPARWKGNLSEMLSRPAETNKRRNQPAIQLKDAATWFAALRKREGASGRALEFATLTAARSGEVRGMVWSEVDIEGKLWTIPKVRMKAEREHRVPLTDETVALLQALPKIEGSGFVFSAPRGGALSDMSLSAVMRRMHETEVEAKRKGWLDRATGQPAVPHGLRSTFRDWAAERTEYPQEMAELALAHAVGNKVEAAYRRGDMMEKRRVMMADWAAFLQGRT